MSCHAYSTSVMSFANMFSPTVKASFSAIACKILLHFSSHML